MRRKVSYHCCYVLLVWVALINVFCMFSTLGLYEDILCANESDPEDNVGDNNNAKKPFNGMFSVHSQDVEAALNAGQTMEVVDLSTESFNDLAPLTKLNPKTLILTDCDEITDFSPLQKMTSLEVLRLSGTQFADLRLLMGLKLQRLSLCGCPIKDYSPLANITTLRELRIGGREAGGSLPVLRNLHLETLWLENNRSGNEIGFAALEGVKELKTLFLRFVNDCDCEKLSRLRLQHLAFDNCEGIFNLHAISRISSLQDFGMMGSTVSDLGFLSGLSLRSLTLRNCSKLTDISPLTRMATLKKLTLSGSSVSSLAPLKNLRLQELEIDYCKGIADLSPLHGQTSLQRFSADGTQFGDTPLPEIIKTK